MTVLDATTAATISRLTRERDDAMRMADRWRDLCEKATAALKGADAEIVRLRARLAEAEVAVGWWCTACDFWNASAGACGRCTKAKPVQS